MAEIIKENWTPYMLHDIHWDSKLVSQFQNKFEKVEILPVLVLSGLNTKLLKLPGVPSFTSDVKQLSEALLKILPLSYLVIGSALLMEQ